MTYSATKTTTRSDSSRRGRFRNMSTFALCTLCLCLSAILECRALPRPQVPSDDFRRNFAIKFGAPLITPLQDHITLDVNSKYLLRCEANGAIKWKTPRLDLQYEVETFDTLDPERPHGSILHLNEVSAQDVGYYYCIKTEDLGTALYETEEQLVELVNNNQASNIYIYVNDKDNLLVPIEYSVGYAHQFEDIVIPCKPTIPTVEVLLTTPNDMTFSSETTGRYDPRRGFVIEIRGLTDTGTFICRPKIPAEANEEEEAQIEILFDGNEHMDPPLELAATTTKTTKRTVTDAEIATSTESTVTNQANVTNSTVNHLNAGDTRIVANSHVNVNVDFDVNVNKPDAAAVEHNGVGEVDDNDADMGNAVDDTEKRQHFAAFNVTGDGHTVNMLKRVDVLNRSTGSDELLGNTSTSDHVSTGVFFTTVAVSIYENVNVGVGGGVVGVDGKGVGVGVGAAGGAAIRYQSKRDLSSSNVSQRASSYSNLTSTKRPRTNFINKPIITSDTNGHVYEGDTFQLKCEVSIAHDVRFSTDWITPPGVDLSRIEKVEATFKNHTATHRVGSAVLTVKNAMKSDEGKYKCHVVDQSKNKAHTTYTMTILKRGETYLNVSEPSGYYKINALANNTVTMTVKYRGYPMPTLEWFKPDGNKIANLANKYDVNTTATTSTLKILKAQMVDTGQYVLYATNGVNSEKLEFQVKINDTPIVTVEDVYVQVGEEAHVICKVLAYPEAIVSWIFTPCSISPRWPSCDKKIDQSFNSTSSARPGERNIETLFELYFTPEKPGIMHCAAANLQGKSLGKGHVLIGDIAGNMTVYGVDENRKIARGDDVTITCAALAYFYSDDLHWYKGDVEVVESDDVAISSSTSDYSYKKSLRFKSIHERDQGNYECRARHANHYEQEDSKFMSIFVFEPLAPTIVSTNLDSKKKIERKLGEPMDLECKSEAIPRASVNWYRDEVLLQSSKHVRLEEDNSRLLIKYMKPEDEGVYKCVVANNLGAVEASTTVKITDLPNSVTLGWILGILFFFIFLIVLVIYLFVRINRERKLLRELKAAGLANFEEGAVEHINPALTLDEQADLLPYDRHFEFPRDKLKLGKQLGAGAFGVVLKAHAEGIKPEERESVVAVKMVKRTADNEVMRALVSELKIMVHLGQHLNVVNLLGAVTKNIAKRELMVIVEYCRFGNIQNFLLRNRKRFIDQINPDTDKIDPTITTQRFSDNFESSRNSDSDPRSGTRPGRPNSRGYLRQSDLYEGHVDSCATEQTIMTTVPEDEDNVLSNNSVQPAWRSNYKPDSTEAMTITTSDLVSWAFQVARGMEYLSSKKVLHGDLAARNILLCEDNVVKICDFGLARSMYKSDNYKKQGEAPLPIKWLALESLSDHVFSTYTDVWSFGIVMWEFFSLAKVPYPGMDPNQNLYLKLKDGYRMDKPAFANDELYDIMLECWSTNPESRPLFNVLEKKFARLLGDEVTSHYVDLNDPYLRTNCEYMKRMQTDYLALMGSPDEMAPPPPRYVNGHILPEIRIEPSSDDYLQMSTDTGTTIFSPTRLNDYEITTAEPTTTANATSFTFPDGAQQHSPTLANNLDSPANKSRKKEGVDVQPEEMPMLHHTQQPSSEGESSPEQGRKFANMLQQARHTPTPSPRHHVAETQLTNGDGGDNYVNVKSPKKLLNNNGERKAADAFSNPSYQMLKTVAEGDKP